MEQLLPFDVDGTACSDVDEESDENYQPMMISIGSLSEEKPLNCASRVHSPYRRIEGSDTEYIPVFRNPTPQRCVAIGARAIIVSDKHEGEGGNEWYAITARKVHWLNLAQLASVVAAEKGQIYVTCHGQRPAGISGHEPEKYVSAHHLLLKKKKKRGNRGPKKRERKKSEKRQSGKKGESRKRN
jgi:hypothetical protein